MKLFNVLLKHPVLMGIYLVFIMITPAAQGKNYPRIQITDQQNTILELVPEPLSRLCDTPIKRTRDRINASHLNENFFSIYRLESHSIENEALLRFVLEIGDQPLRISFISIKRQTRKDNRILTFQASLYLRENSELNAQIPSHHYFDELSFIIAEQVDSEEDISYGVEAMKIIRTHNLVPVIVDYGTNWLMTEVNIELEVFQKNKDVMKVDLSLEKFLNMFSNIKWIIAIRFVPIET